MTRSTIVTILYVLIAALTWLPGCFYEQSMKRQMEEVHAAIMAMRADTVPLTWGGNFEIPFDTVVQFDAAQFTGDPASLADGSLCKMEGPDGLHLVGQYDTTRGVMRFTLYRPPMTVKGSARLRTQEYIKRNQGGLGTFDNLGTHVIGYQTAAGMVPPSPPWWKVAGFLALFLGGCWYIDYRFFP